MKYRKKPVVIEAVALVETNRDALIEWCGGHRRNNHQHDIVVPALGGDVVAVLGDYIVKGVKGEFYPCKPDIFVRTYELAEEAEYPMRWVGGKE